jgi:precorrin-2 dehydrogenase / sirohydrochlorin ferrochelatase
MAGAENTEERNNLFPIFLKLEELHTLIVGGGNVGLEKLSGLLKSSPGARITVVAEKISSEVNALAAQSKNIFLHERSFRIRDLQNKDIVILATDDKSLHERIRAQARKKRILVNVADTPDLCDFYLGSVVTKGNIKIGISTNGKSPTIAKRMREYFEEVLPDNTNQLLDNMQKIRDKIKGDFRRKVDVLNEITASWLGKP